MDNSTKNALKGTAYVAGAGLDSVVMYTLADKTAQHCEKLGDTTLSASYWAGIGMIEVGLLTAGIVLLVKGIQKLYNSDARYPFTTFEEISKELSKPRYPGQ